MIPYLAPIFGSFAENRTRTGLARLEPSGLPSEVHVLSMLVGLARAPDVSMDELLGLPSLMIATTPLSDRP